MKQAKSLKNTTPLLITSVGTYHGEDILEGFAADEDYLATKSNEENHTWYDNSFYRLCKMDN